jgi:hypothetical protein
MVSQEAKMEFPQVVRSYSTGENNKGRMGNVFVLLEAENTAK